MPSYRDLLLDEEVRSISRRYFISNGFDGTLTSTGIIVGAFLSGITDGFTVIQIGVGAAVGLATSGVWSVWEIERAEKRSERLHLESAMLRDLEGTRLERELRGARTINATASGIGPVIGILSPLVPFLAAGSLVTLLEATLIGIAIGVGLLFVFGAYLGSISEQSWIVAGVRMGLAGIVVAAINVMLPG